MIIAFYIFLYFIFGAFTLGIAGDEDLEMIFWWPLYYILQCLKLPFKLGSFLRNRFFK